MEASQGKCPEGRAWDGGRGGLGGGCGGAMGKEKEKILQISGRGKENIQMGGFLSLISEIRINQCITGQY